MIPLQPISDFLEIEITIPWFAIPYNAGVLGSPRCKTTAEAGYSSSFISNTYKDRCKENCPGGIWYQTSGQCKMSCSSVGLSEDGGNLCDLSDACSNARKYRDRTNNSGFPTYSCPSHRIKVFPPVCYST